MAESIANHFFKESVDAKSGGTAPSQVNPNAVKVLAEIGIDASQNRSKHINDFNNDNFDYSISLCGNPTEGTCPVFFGKVNSRLHWPFPDPADATGSEDKVLEVFRKVRDDIKSKIEKFVNRDF